MLKFQKGFVGYLFYLASARVTKSNSFLVIDQKNVGLCWQSVVIYFLSSERNSALMGCSS